MRIKIVVSGSSSRRQRQSFQRAGGGSISFLKHFLMYPYSTPQRKSSRERAEGKEDISRKRKGDKQSLNNYYNIQHLQTFNPWKHPFGLENYLHFIDEENKRLNNLTKGTQLLRDEVRIQTQVCLSAKPALFISSGGYILHWLGP